MMTAMIIIKQVDSESVSNQYLDEPDWDTGGSGGPSNCYVSSDFIMTQSGSCCLPTELDMPVLR